jgi:hypothetical protein
MDRAALHTLATQLAISLGEMNEAIRKTLSEPAPESALAQSPPHSEPARVDARASTATPPAQSPFRRPSARVATTAEPDIPRSRNALLDAVLAALRRLVRSTSPARRPVPTRPTTKRFRSPRHRVRKR